MRRQLRVHYLPRVVKQGFNKLGEASEQEEDMLDKAPGLTPTSRLGCQAVIEDPDGGDNRRRDSAATRSTRSARPPKNDD